ncbi:hypothetical protein R3P38DRAFT_3376857 [Favolaschia claudopus]|uniref:Terpene synthase n=1 Tax=Favolaschia claudopus TaxID=2862362 RepID=A0AAV9ZDC4_9AGAR
MNLSEESDFFSRPHGVPTLPGGPHIQDFPLHPPDLPQIRAKLSGRPSAHLVGLTKLLASEGLHLDYKLPHKRTPKKKNFADILIHQNRDLWFQYMYNRFCWTMAVSREPVDPHFKDYCEQDYAAIWAYVRHMAWKASACSVIQDVIQDASTIAEVQLFGMDWKDLVMDNFASRGYELDSKKLTPAMEKFIEWMQAEARRAGETKDYFRLNVVMTPCIFGYPKICKLLKRHISPDKFSGESASSTLILANIFIRDADELFKTVWIDPNDTDHFVKQIRAYFDSVPARNPGDYTGVFREAIQHDIDVFASFLPPFFLPFIWPWEVEHHNLYHISFGLDDIPFSMLKLELDDLDADADASDPTT